MDDLTEWFNPIVHHDVPILTLTYRRSVWRSLESPESILYAYLTLPIQTISYTNRTKVELANSEFVIRLSFYYRSQI